MAFKRIDVFAGDEATIMKLKRETNAKPYQIISVLLDSFSHQQLVTKLKGEMKKGRWL